jgi:hypothetical protein
MESWLASRVEGGCEGNIRIFDKVYHSPNIFQVIKSRRMRWTWYVARMGERWGVYRVLVGKPEGKRPLWCCRKNCVLPTTPYRPEATNSTRITIYQTRTNSLVRSWGWTSEVRNIVEHTDSWIYSVIQEYCVSVRLHTHCKMIHGPYNIKYIEWVLQSCLVYIH